MPHRRATPAVRVSWPHLLATKPLHILRKWRKWGGMPSRGRTPRRATPRKRPKADRESRLSVQAAVLTAAVRHAAGVLGRTGRRARFGDVGRRNAPLPFQAAIAARRARRLLIGPHQFLELVPALLACVFVDGHEPNPHKRPQAEANKLSTEISSSRESQWMPMAYYTNRPGLGTAMFSVSGTTIREFR